MRNYSITSRLTVIALLLTASGCNVIGVAANVVAGGKTTPAMFNIPKRATIVIAEIGLTLVQRLVVLHGGMVEARSEGVG